MSPFIPERLPAVEYSPHYGLTMVTSWDHKDGTRIDMPSSVADAVAAMNGANSFKGDASRAVVSVVIASCFDTTQRHERAGWTAVEVEQYRFERLAGGGQRWVWSFNIEDVPQWRLNHPGGEYSRLVDSIEGGPDGTHLDLAPDAGHYNYVSVGRALKVWGGNRIELGAGFVVHTFPEFFLSFGPPHVVEKDGVKFVKVDHNGVLYGLRLEPLGEPKRPL